MRYWFDRTDEVNKSLRHWIDFSLFEGKEVDKMRYAINSSNEIKQAHDVYERFTASDKLRWAYDARLRAKSDNATMMRHHREEGREEGKTEVLYEMVKNFEKIGVSFDKIAEATGLSVEEIKKIGNS